MWGYLENKSRSLMSWMEGKAQTKHARAWLFAMSFSESSFFLIPPDVLLIAMLASKAGRWVYLATLTSVASVLGALFGYALGLFVFEPLVQPLIALYGLVEEFAHVGTLYEQNVFLAVLAAAFTPIPFKVFVLAGGFFHVSFVPFIAASIIGRSARFFMVAWVAHRYGPRATQLFLDNFRNVTLTIVAVIVCIVAAWMYFG